MTTRAAIGAVVFGCALIRCAEFQCMTSAQSGSQPSTSPAKSISVDLGEKVTLNLALIPAGKFNMGSPVDEKDRNSDEGQHEVAISRPFYIGVCSVTQRQWTAVMGTEPWKEKDFVKEGGEYPATYVSWVDASEFCRKLSEKTRMVVRLPTEAEREYACRAGSRTRFCYGDDANYAVLGEYAWYYNNAWAAGEKYAHAVGQKRPNAWGLHDMHGNVWEWCSDWYAAYPEKAQTDPKGPDSGSLRVLRGGSFGFGLLGYYRAAYRFNRLPGERWHSGGFRVVIDMPVGATPATSPIAVQK